MKEVWIHKANSFREADEFERDYYRAMSAEERLETMQFLREIYHKIEGTAKSGNESRKGLRRVITVVQ